MSNESEIKSWLQDIFNTDDFLVQIEGNSEKGDGYLGDIIFVSLIPVNAKATEEHSLVLKCSKRSRILRERAPVKEMFVNEIYIYDRVFPEFKKFQQEKSVLHVFNSVPKYHGKFISEEMEVIVLENLKKTGYDLWNKTKPLTRKHVTMVLEEYAELHSVSIAMKDQQPQRFQELTEGLRDNLSEFLESTGVVPLFGSCIDEICTLLKSDLDENTLTTWLSLKQSVVYIINDMVAEQKGSKVILHGDCWCNNFMFKPDIDDDNSPVKVAILDWQVSRYASPILDLSYFLFAGISKDDLEDLSDILDYYYGQLTLRCERLGTNLEALYPKNQFLEDWRKYCKFGIMMASVVFKLCVTEKDEVVDIEQAAENSNDCETTFIYDVKNKDALRERARDVVNYVATNGLV